jgi:hypothetical protein
MIRYHRSSAGPFEQLIFLVYIILLQRIIVAACIIKDLQAC